MKPPTVYVLACAWTHSKKSKMEKQRFKCSSLMPPAVSERWRPLMRGKCWHAPMSVTLGIAVPRMSIGAGISPHYCRFLVRKRGRRGRYETHSFPPSNDSRPQNIPWCMPLHTVFLPDKTFRAERGVHPIAQKRAKPRIALRIAALFTIVHNNSLSFVNAHPKKQDRTAF